MSQSLRWVVVIGLMAVVLLALASWWFLESQPELQAMVTLKRQLADTLGHRRARLARIESAGEPGLKVIVPLDAWPADAAARRKLQDEVALFVRQQYAGADREALRFVQVDLVAETGSGCSSKPVLDSRKTPFHQRPAPQGKRR